MKTNHYFKLFAIYLLIFFTGCQEETVLDLEENTLIEQDNSFRITENSFEDEFKKETFKNTYLKYEHIKKNALELHTSKIDPDVYNFTIDKSNVKVVKIGDFISYTIPIHRKIVSNDYFENLVLQTNAGGGIKAFLIKYTHNKSIKEFEEHSSIEIKGAYKITPLDASKLRLTASGCGGSWQAWCSFDYDHLAGERCYQYNLDKITIVYVENDCEFAETSFAPPTGSGSGGGLFLNSINDLEVVGGSSIQISDPFIVPTLPDGTVVNFEEDMARSLAFKLNITNQDQIDYLMANFRTVIDINVFLESNDTSEGREFVKFAIEVKLLEPDCGRLGNDCVKSIEVMAAGLRKFHGEEGALMAELFESFIEDTSFTLRELAEFKAFATEITQKYNDYMAGKIILAFGEGVLPIFEFVLFETGTTLAIRILQKIPVSWVLRGARLNKVVKTTVELGVKGTQEHVNIIATSGPVTKANEMFLSLTKNAVSTSSANGVTVANMGNGNFITYRTVSKSGFPATLDFNFPALFGETKRVLKFKNL